MALVTAAAEENGSGLRWVVRARLGGGKCKVAFWLTPPAYIDGARQPKSLLSHFSLNLANLAYWPFCIPKILKLN